MTSILTTMRPPATILTRSAFGLIAAATLLATSTSVFAGTKEITALNTQLAPKTIATATSTELRNAVVFFTVPTNNPGKLDPSVIAGEALKGATTFDAGTEIAAGLAGVTFPVPFGTKTIADRNTFAKVAIKTTGSGKGATLAQVAGFTQGLFTAPQAIDLAKLVKGTKGAAGEVFKGGANQVADAGNAKANYLLPALVDKLFSAVLTDITKGVSATVGAGLSAAFTTAVVTPNVANKSIDKIITGIVAGKPTDAGVITDTALTGQNSLSVIGKAAGKLAKSIGAVADIEQIQKVGEAIAKNSIAIGGLKITTAKSIIGTLAKAIGAKPASGLIGGKGTDPLLATADATLVKNSEKADELGELAAYFVNALITSAQFTALKDDAARGKLIADLMKTVVTSGKLADKTKGVVKPTVTDIANYTKLMGVYVAGSVSLTIGSSTLAQPLKDAIEAAVNKVAKGLAGKGNDALVTAAITNGFDGTTGLSYENGTIALSPLTDPETNTRNF